jgi:hypothetical protein
LTAPIPKTRDQTTKHRPECATKFDELLSLHVLHLKDTSLDHGLNYDGLATKLPKTIRHFLAIATYPTVYCEYEYRQKPSKMWTKNHVYFLQIN